MLPNGLTFNNSTFIIMEIPHLNIPIMYGISIGNGRNGTYQLQVLSNDTDPIANKYEDNDDNDPWFDELDGCPISIW